MDQPTEKPQDAAHTAEADVQENKDIAAFSYLWVMSIVVYLLRPHSAFARYHSKQAILLFILSFPVWFIPFGLGRFLELIILGAMVLGFMNAAQGQWKDIPLIGPLSRREMTIREAWKIIVEGAARLAKSVTDLARSQQKNPPSSGTPPAASPKPPEHTPPSTPSL